MKKIALIILIVHTLVIAYVLWSDLTTIGEDWSWMLAFAVDFPLSIGIQQMIEFLGWRGQLYTSASIMLFIAYLVIGGAWWVLVAALVRKVCWKLAGHGAKPDHS